MTINNEAKPRFSRVALIGAGAVGAYFIYGFSELSDIDFCVIAEGQRAERLKKEGIIINNRNYYPGVKSSLEAKGADLLLVCTKYQGLDSVLDMIENVVDEHTTVMSLLNGIDSEQIIGDRIGSQHMLYSVTRISSERRDDKIFFDPATTIGISVGEIHDKSPSKRMLAFADLMEGASLKYAFKDDILLDQWAKFSMNIIYNLPQAVVGVGFGAFYDSKHLAAIRDRMFDEVCAVAHAEGIALSKQADWRKACVPQARFSTLQDLDAGRCTEIDLFTGILLKLAKKNGIDVPFCEYTHYAIKTLEEKNQGLFIYNI